MGGFVPVYYSLSFLWRLTSICCIFLFSQFRVSDRGTRVGWGDGNEGEGEGKEEGCEEGAFKDSIGGVDEEERFGVEISSVEFEDEQFVVTEEEEDIDVVVTTQGGALRTLEGENLWIAAYAEMYSQCVLLNKKGGKLIKLLL